MWRSWDREASAVHVLDYVYLQGRSDPDGRAGASTLAFTLNEHGVTPITIESRRDGLRIMHDAKGRVRLEIGLGAVPPRDNVTLVSSHLPIRGTFDGLPEGGEITAQYAGRTYRWKLTYRGGPSGFDLVLKNQSEYAENAPVTHSRPIPRAPAPLWREHPLFPPYLPKGAPAFPGAEGFGAYTPGGRGGKVLYVDNLDDSGPGSLRQAIETPGPRTVLFRVEGVIPLKSDLDIREPFLTIDGQKAPGAGITLRNRAMNVRTHDVVLRYFRIRVGDDDVPKTGPWDRYAAADAGHYALYFKDGANNCIADHLSLSWSTDKTLSTSKVADLITIQWCILSEALNFANHGYASITAGNRITWHHNLFAHNLSRNVRFMGPVQTDFRNNVVYDWGDTAAYGEFDWVNYVGNYLKPGPSTTPWARLFHDGRAVVAPGSLYVSGNVMEGNAAVNQDNWKGMGYGREAGASEPFPAPPVTIEAATDAYEHVLASAGATLPRRDSIDERIMREVREGTGHIIKFVQDVGGWPAR